MKKISLYFSLKIDVFEHQLFIIWACSPCLTRTTIKNRNVVKLSAQMPYFFVVRFIYFYFPLYQCRPPFFYSSYKSIQYIRLTESLCYLVKKAGIYKYILTLWLMLIYIGNYIFLSMYFAISTIFRQTRIYETHRNEIGSIWDSITKLTGECTVRPFFYSTNR